MATRSRKLADLEATEALDGSPTDVPGIMPPPGVNAKVRTQIEYQRMIDPEADAPQQRGRYTQELEDLAEEEAQVLSPADPLSSFVEEWANYAGWPMKIVRLQDPAQRRMPGQTYNRPNFSDIEHLGDTVFDPINLVSTLQIYNGNSGGIFRVWLTNTDGVPVPGARLDRVAVVDPPRAMDNQRGYQNGRIERYEQRYNPQPQPAPAPVERQKSEMEIRIEALQAQLFETAIARALAQPPPTPPPVDQYAGMSEEDRLTLMLVKHGGIMPNVLQRITSFSQSPDTAAAIEKTDWKERGVNALMSLVETNPAIVDRVSGVIERIVNKVLPDPRAPQAPQFQTAPPPQQLQPAPPALANPSAPQAQNPEDDEAEDDEIMAILEDLFSLLSSNKPLTANDPVFAGLARDYPVKFRMAITLIGSQSVEDIIAYLSAQNPLYDALLAGPATGPHFRARIVELKALIEASKQPQPANAETAPAEPVQA